MARVSLSHPIDTLQGQLSHHERIIFRQKYAYSPSGSRLQAYAPESYIIANPRDWNRHPAQGNELANMQRFSEAGRLTKQAIASDSPARAEWQRRWEAQLHHAESDAPIDKRTGQRKIYARLDKYVLSHILRDLNTSAQ